MSSPGGSEVGRLSIKVLPDTSAFADKLRADLAKIEQSEKLTIPVEFDLDTAKLRADLAAMNVPTIHVPVDIDEPNIPPTIPVGADTTKAKAEVDAEVADINTKNATVNVDVKIDKDIIAQRLATANIKAQLEIDQTKFLASVEAAKLAAERIAKVKATVDVDKRSLGTFLSDIGQGISKGLSVVGSAISNILTLGGSLSGLFQNIGSGAASIFSSIGEGLTKIGPGLVSALSSLVGFILQAGTYGAAFAAIGAAAAAAWGLVSAAVLAVPAALGLVGIAVGAVALGMDGIKKAAEVLKPSFDALKKAVSDTFQAQLTPVFQQLATIMPTVQAGMVGVASALSSVAAGVVNFVTSSQGVSLIKTLFDNVAVGIRNVEPGIEGLISGFLRLAGSKAGIDAIVGTVNTLGVSLNEMAIQLQNSGVLTTAFQGLQKVLESISVGLVAFLKNGVTLFSTLAPAIAGFTDSLTGFFNKFDYKTLGAAVASVFQGITTAINGVPQSTITAIQAAFVNLGNAFKSPEFITVIQGLISILPQVINDIADFINFMSSMGVVIATVAGYLKSLNPQFDALNSSVLKVIANLLTTNDVFGVVGSGIATFASGIAGVFVQGLINAATAIGTFVEAVRTALGDRLLLIVSAVASIGSAIGTALVQRLSLIGTVVGAIATNIATNFMIGLNQIIAGVATVFTTIATNVVAGGAQIVAGIVAIATNIATNFMIGLNQIITGVAAFFTLIGTTFAAGWAAVTAGVAVAWTFITTTITTILTTLLATITTWGTTLLTLLTTVWTTITTGVTTAWTAITTAITTALTAVVTLVTTIGASILAALTAAWAAVQAGVAAAWAAVTSAVSTGVSAVVSAVAALPGQAVAALGALVSGLASIGTNAINALVSAIASGASAVVSAIVGMVSAAIAAAKSALGIGSPSKVFAWIAKMTGQGFIVATNQIAPAVVSSVKAMTAGVIAEGAKVQSAFDLSGVGLPDLSSSTLPLGRLNAATLATGVSGTPGGASTIINSVVNNPVPEKASNSIDRRLRTLSAIGAFG